MSKNVKERIKNLEKTLPSGKPIFVLEMWMPHGRTVHPNTGNIRIRPSNPEE